MTSHGGSRPGAGRTYAYREPLRHVTVTLPDSYIEQLRRFGDDNLSEGIRLLVEEARTPTGRPWYVLPDWAKDPKASNHPPIDTPAHS
jgi:hypothetical protein